MNKNSCKSLITILLLVVIVFAMTMNVAAKENSTTNPEPRWVSIFTIDLNIAFNNGTGTVSGIATKQSTANMIEGTLYLYQFIDDEWVYVDEWYKSKAVGTLGINATFVCERGVTYKAVFTVTAYTNGVAETETIEYSKICP